MAYLGLMSLGSAIFMALVSVSYVTGITNTIGSYAEHVDYNLAQVAQMHQFEFAIRSTNPSWHSEGIQIFAYRLKPFGWQKKKLTWNLKNNPTSLPVDSVVADLKGAFMQWSTATQFAVTFDRAGGQSRADIVFEFFPEGLETPVVPSRMDTPKSNDLDSVGVLIRINDSDPDIWTNVKNPRYTTFRFVALYEIGHALGIDNTTERGAIMFGKDTRGLYYRKEVPTLSKDDKDAIKDKFGLPISKYDAPVPQ